MYLRNLPGPAAGPSTGTRCSSSTKVLFSCLLKSRQLMQRRCGGDRARQLGRAEERTDGVIASTAMAASVRPSAAPLLRPSVRVRRPPPFERAMAPDGPLPSPSLFSSFLSSLFLSSYFPPPTPSPTPSAFNDREDRSDDATCRSLVLACARTQRSSASR